MVGQHQKSPHKGGAGAGKGQLRLKAPVSPNTGFALSPDPIEMVVWAGWASVPFSCLPTSSRCSGQDGYAQVLRDDHLHVSLMAPGIHIIFFPTFFLQRRTSGKSLALCCSCVAGSHVGESSVDARKSEEILTSSKEKEVTNSAVVPVHPLKGECPSSAAPKKRRAFSSRLDADISSKLLLQHLLVQAMWLNVFCFFLSCSFLHHPPWGISQASPHFVKQ